MLHLLRRLIHTIIVSLILLMISCDQKNTSLKNSDSELLQRITAVQQQMQQQGNISEKEKRAILSLVSLVSSDGMVDPLNKNSLAFNEVEIAPVFPGCEEFTKEKSKQCFTERVTEFVNAEFDINIAKSLNLSGAQKIEVFFVINDKGILSNLKVRDTNLELQAEAVRVIRKIPHMIPASHHGNNVSVIYHLPIILNFNS